MKGEKREKERKGDDKKQKIRLDSTKEELI